MITPSPTVNKLYERLQKNRDVPKVNLPALARRDIPFMESWEADPDHVIISSDFTSLEPSITAHFSKDYNYSYATYYGIGKEPYILSSDPDKQAKVKKYNSPEESIKDFLSLIKTGSNFEGVRESIARGDDTINYFDGLGKYAEKEDYTEFLKDVYITRIAKLMNPQDDTGRLILPVKKSLNEQMNKLK